MEKVKNLETIAKELNALNIDEVTMAIRWEEFRAIEEEIYNLFNISFAIDSPIEDIEVKCDYKQTHTITFYGVKFNFIK